MLDKRCYLLRVTFELILLYKLYKFLLGFWGFDCLSLSDILVSAKTQRFCSISSNKKLVAQIKEQTSEPKGSAGGTRLEKSR